MTRPTKGGNQVEESNVIIDKEEDDLILNSECRQIMWNLCNIPGRRKSFHYEGNGLAQPSILSTKEHVLFFKMKMFFLLEGRHSFLQQCSGQPCSRPAEAYAPFLSPFYESEFDELAMFKKRRRRRFRKFAVRMKQDNSKAAESQPVGHKVHTKSAKNMQRPDYEATFLESLRKADTTMTLALEEKILKTTEGTGYASLFGNNRGTRATGRAGVILSLFPDYNRLLQDGKDEESKLDNLVNHVRNRMKYFDKLQLFYENDQSNHTAHVFTVRTQDVVNLHEEISGLIPKRAHELDEGKLQKLYEIFKDDYSAASTTLVADGTQPVVLNRKKYDDVKKYVDDCEDWQGKVLVPYNAETNFFFLTFPWTRSHEKDEAVGEPNGLFKK